MVELSKGVGFCVLSNYVLCSFRTSDRVGFMHRCWKCPHFERIMREMDEEDVRVMDEIEQIHKYGYPVDGHTLMTSVEFHKANFCACCGCKLDSGNCSDVKNVCRRCMKSLEM